MAQEERSREMPHSVILEGREKLTISGVTDVHSFDEEQVLLETVRGMLVVRGQGLHVERLQLEAGELIIQGEIGLLEYDDSVQPRDQPVSADIRRVSGHAGVYEQPAGHARAAKPAARCRDRGGV